MTAFIAGLICGAFIAAYVIGWLLSATPSTSTAQGELS